MKQPERCQKLPEFPPTNQWLYTSQQEPWLFLIAEWKVEKPYNFILRRHIS